MSDTPRTDMVREHCGPFAGPAWNEMFRHARTLERELSAARAELEEMTREHEAAALSGQRQLLAKYDGALRQLEGARECLREAILREIVWSAHCHCSLTDMSMDEYTAMLSKWRKAAGMDATAGEVKA